MEEIGEERVGSVDQRLDGIGARLRSEREQAGLSQRQLAHTLGLSPSMISQLESGVSKPSVGTLYAIVTELNISLDRLFAGEESAPAAEGSSTGPESPSPLRRSDDCQSITLASGVRWDDLASERNDGVDFLRAVYEVGGASTQDESLMRHSGREYGYVIEGTLGVQVGFREYVLEPGDSIAYDSTRPHRLFNKGDEPVEAIWFVLGWDS